MSNDIQWDDEQVTWDDAPKQPRTFREELGRQLGLTARIPVQAATGTAGILTDAATGLYNEAMDYYDKQRAAKLGELVTGKKTTGPRFQSVAPALNKIMTGLGLPEPETDIEKAVQFFGPMFGGGADVANRGVQAAASRMAPAGFQAAMPANAAVAKELLEAKIPVLPTAAGGGFITRSLQGLGGSEKTAELARTRAQPALQSLASQETGVPAKNLTAAALNAASRQVSEETYKPIKDLGTVYLGRASTHPYNRELDSIVAKYDTIDQSKQLLDRIGKFREQKMPANVVLERIAQLRSDASGAFADNHRSYGKALREVADALENQIERNLRNPAVLDAYRAGRAQIARNNAVKDMLVDKHTGIIDSVKAQKLLEDNVPLTGGLQTIAKAGSRMYSGATTPPIAGAGTPVNMGAQVFQDSPGFFSTAVAPFRAAARQATLSGPVQRSLARGLQERPPPTIFGNEARLVGAAAAPPFFSLFEQ